MAVYVPNIREQKKIAKILSQAEDEITSLKQLAEQYRIQKCGLMQKLLAGKWRISKNTFTQNVTER